MPDLNAGLLPRFAELVMQVSPVPIDAASLSGNTRLADDLALDSISRVALMALVEEDFGISFADHLDAVAEIQTIYDALGLIQRLTPVAQ